MAFLPMAAMVASVGGAALGGLSAYSSGMFNAQVAKNNAEIMRQNAEYATKAGMVKAEKESMKGRAVGGRVKTAQAASGVDVNTGSAVDVQVGQRQAANLDTQHVMDNAGLEAYGYRTKAMDYDAKAELSESQAMFGAWGGALKAGGSFAEGWPSVSGGFSGSGGGGEFASSGKGAF